MAEYTPRLTTVHKSLLEIKTFGGVEFRMAAFNLIVAGAITLALTTPWYLPAAFLLHIFLRWLTKRDPLQIPIYMRWRLLAELYDPWPHRSMETNARPIDFERDMLC